MAAAVTVDQIASAPNLREVLDAYAAESAIAGMPSPAAQFPVYRNLESQGLLHAFASFDGNRLVAVLFLMVAFLPHYGAKVGTTESFFVLEAYRKDGHGLRLKQLAEEFATQAGAVGMLISAPYGGKLSKVLAASTDYAPSNTVYFKRLTP